MQRVVKPLLIALSCTFLSACSLAPGVYMSTQDVNTSKMQQQALASATLMQINDKTIHHLSKASDCRASSGNWICDNANSYHYVIGAGDVLSITVYDHPELTNPQGEYRSQAETGIRVRSDGSIFYPFVGDVEVAGLNVEQVGIMLTKRIKKYIQAPQIDVRVAQFNSKKVQVLGEVLRPSTVAVTNIPLSLMDAINQAGGINALTADGKYIYVVRGPASHPTLFWLNLSKPDAFILAEKFYLRNSDIVYVSTAGLARWQRVITSLLPTAQTGGTVNESIK